MSLYKIVVVVDDVNKFYLTIILNSSGDEKENQKIFNSEKIFLPITFSLLFELLVPKMFLIFELSYLICATIELDRHACTFF